MAGHVLAVGLVRDLDLKGRGGGTSVNDFGGMTARSRLPLSALACMIRVNDGRRDRDREDMTDKIKVHGIH